jgi:hypothetical protein
MLKKMKFLVVVLKQQQVEEMQELKSYAAEGNVLLAPTNFERTGEVEKQESDHLMQQCNGNEEIDDKDDDVCNDVKIEDCEGNREPEIADSDSVFFATLEGMIEELKMWNFDEDYAKEEKENTLVVEGDSDKEKIGKERKKLKVCRQCQ